MWINTNSKKINLGLILKCAFCEWTPNIRSATLLPTQLVEGTIVVDENNKKKRVEDVIFRAGI